MLRSGLEEKAFRLQISLTECAQKVLQQSGYGPVSNFETR